MHSGVSFRLLLTLCFAVPPGSCFCFFPSRTTYQGQTGCFLVMLAFVGSSSFVHGVNWAWAKKTKVGVFLHFDSPGWHKCPALGFLLSSLGITNCFHLHSALIYLGLPPYFLITFKGLHRSLLFVVLFAVITSCNEKKRAYYECFKNPLYGFFTHNTYCSFAVTALILIQSDWLMC